MVTLRSFYPNMYVKNIFNIDYERLKKRGVHCLIFDLDNTIALIDQKKVDNKTKKLFNHLKKDFQIVIISNNTKKRVEEYASFFNCDYASFAMKPLPFGYFKIKKKYHLQKKDMAMIGDQLVTDIFVGNRMTGYTILVDPLGKKDLKITTLNRYIESKIFRYYEKKAIMKRGSYYVKK